MPDAPVNSWGMVFDPAVASKFADCGIYMLDASDDMIAAALNYLGLDPNSTDQADLDKAQRRADEGAALRPQVPLERGHQRAGVNGDICLATIYSGDAGIAADARRGGEERRRASNT